MDESGFSLVPPLRKTWAPRGQTPTLCHQTSWPKLSAISGVTVSKRLLLSLVHGTIQPAQVVNFLRSVLRHIPGPVIVLWDGLPAHRSQAVQDFAADHPRLQIEPLPSYAPELNGDEGVWGWLKGEVLGNFCAHDLGELEAQVHKGVRRLRARPELILAFIKRTGLDIDGLIN